MNIYKIWYKPFIAIHYSIWVYGIWAMLIFLMSCNNNKLSHISFSGKTQGTTYHITYYSADGINYKNETDSILKRIDASLSLYNPKSIISKINNNEQNVLADTLFIECFNQSKAVYALTGGAFDPTVGALVKAWGFGFKSGKKPDSALVDSLRKYIGFHNVRIENNRIIKENPEISLDFNAIAQGFSCDIIGRFLESRGIKNYLIEIGGEVLAKGTKENNEEWTIGIEKPDEGVNTDRKIITAIKLKNKAVTTSGSYRKFYIENGIKRSHTIDPSSGEPVRHNLLSVSVIADKCAMADALATAFMVMGVEKSMIFLEKRPEFGAYFIFSDKDGKLKAMGTKNFIKKISKVK